MFKKILWLMVSVTVIIVGIFGFIIISDFKEVVEEVDNEVAKSVKITPEELVEKDEIVQVKENVNPFNETVSMKDLTYHKTEGYIHGMSHQKIKAENDLKWGFYEITEERINWLIEAISRSNFPNKKMYLNILQRWKNGDFSRVDKDHNAIWELQGGTIGRAIGILDAEEEERYIKSQKGNK